MPPVLEEHLILNGEIDGELNSRWRVMIDLIAAEVLPIRQA